MYFVMAKVIEGPNTSKYLDPPVRVLQSSTEVFGLPLKKVDPQGVQIL